MDETRVSTSYEPAFSAGAFGADGRLNLVLVNQEKISMGMTAVDRVTGDRASTGGVVALPKVFFARL